MPLRVTHGTPIPFQAPHLGAKNLNVKQIAQEQSQWCWAACADMVLDYYGDPGARQCDFANWLFGQTGCCTAPGSSLCNQPCSVADVRRVYTQWRIAAALSNNAVSFSTLQSEINGDRPVEVAFSWNGGGGHVAIVCGWDQNTTGPFVRVNDPAYGSGGVYYADLLTAYGMGTWFATWTGIRR